MSVSGCCRNLRITIKAVLHLRLRPPRGSSPYRRIQSRHLSSSSSMADLKSTFLNVYSTLKSDLLHDPSFEFTDASRLWVEKMLDYNVPGGKLNRGLSVVDSFKLLKEGEDLTEEEVFLSCALGWCIEWKMKSVNRPLNQYIRSPRREAQGELSQSKLST
ncbi:hypothetical protein F2Q70_00039582 [Brassica cretica]|uniref:Uncharacterized protein n=1 Tax=Brassica cretica TaxID=69181 RepID=A0A8S9K4Z3_BRACR|nr:hypothetical protein F2Q70_00039582 [Brassica cretica]